MRRVLILIPNDNLGGAEQHLKNIAGYMLSKGYELDVFFLKKETGEGWRDISGRISLYFTKEAKESKGVFSCLIKIFRNRHTLYDYVFTSHVHLNAFAGILIRLGIIKTKFFVGRESTSIFKRYSGMRLQMYKFMYRVGYGKLDLLICQTNYMKEQLVKALPRLASRINIRVVPNPINIKNVKEEMPLTYKCQKYIVSAGRLIHLKGFDLLIRAFASIKDKFPDLKLVILGEGTERTNLELLSEELGVSEKVKLVGFQKDVYPFFKYASVCVVSSRIEGFPNVLLQMMSQSNSVVSTLCAGGIDEIPSILTCETNSFEALAYKITQSLTMENANNREIFDDFLEKRSVPNFVEQINKYLNV